MRDKLGRFTKKHPQLNTGKTCFKKGHKPSREIKDKISQSNLGSAPWNKGKKLSKKHRENLRISHINLLSREKHPNWKGGKSKSKGYISILAPNHPFCSPGGYIREHRVIMEKKLGRYLHRWEVVHHINEIRDDNRIENLLLCNDNTEHRKYHRKKKHIKKSRKPT